MVAATIYIIVCSAKNRAGRWLRRLREPRYFVGAIVGAAYLFFAVLGRARFSEGRSRRVRTPSPSALLPALGTSGPALAGAALLLAAVASWMMPVASGLLEFTPAETALLAPAPVSRRQLLVYRLMRAQWAVLLGAAIFAGTYPSATASARIRGLIGGWLLLMVCHVFFTGVTLARTRLKAPEAGGRLTAWTPLVIVALCLAVVAGAVGRAMGQQQVLTANDALTLVGQLSAGGVVSIALAPFVAVVRPLFADSFASFARVLPLAVLVYGVIVLWVLQMDEALDAISGHAEAQRTRRPMATRAAYRARPVAWTLALTGRHETAFVWKGAIQTLRIVDRRVLWRLVGIVAWVTISVALFNRTRGLAQVLGGIAAFGTAFAIMMMPQILRLDMRQDLQHLEVLKTWPVRAGAILRGEMAWPIAVTTLVAWALGSVAIFLSSAAFSRTGLAWRFAVGSAVMILTPALVAAQYTIHNAVTLMFPAWVPPAGTRPRGLDAMGQRLIMLGGTWLMLVIVVTPGAIVGGVLWLAFSRFVGPWILIPGALITVAIVAFEVLLATEALGPVYERLDLSSVERGE